MHRVQKLISQYGFCSRRQAEEWIQLGKVKVNGKTITIGDKATEEDEISVNGQIISKPKRIYLMFHKPLHCVTALEDEYHKTIFTYINIPQRVIPVGRLDYNTTGLLLLTNDGDFANEVMHPRYEVKKTYEVTIDKPLTKNEARQLREGIQLDDGPTRPAYVKLVNDTTVEVTIHEGKNRIVRRMFEELGYKVRALKRTKIGSLELGSLEVGKWKKLNKHHLKKVFA